MKLRNTQVIKSTRVLELPILWIQMSECQMSQSNSTLVGWSQLQLHTIAAMSKCTLLSLACMHHPSYHLLLCIDSKVNFVIDVSIFWGLRKGRVVILRCAVCSMILWWAEPDLKADPFHCQNQNKWIAQCTVYSSQLTGSISQFVTHLWLKLVPGVPITN